MLKKIIPLVLLAGVLLLCVTSCGGTSNKIVGKWEDKNELIEFKKDGSFSAAYYWIGGSYTIDGDTITLAATLLGKETYTYEIQGNTLTFYNSNGNVEYEFTRIN